MPHFELSDVETRVLGCLLEKERTTPENYPLSLNAITLACNQSTNRDPVVGYDERAVDDALLALREKKLATMIHAAGARVQKFRHNLPDHYSLSAGETALLCVLLLRGPQTPGELRSRTERLHSFGALADVEKVLEELGKGDQPLVRVLPARPGQKERRFVQLLSGEPRQEQLTETPNAASVGPVPQSSSRRLEVLEEEVQQLREEVRELREQFAAFRQQFE